uniref:CSON006088 protein n=1 Tax=Culicoides sonorensis TaxID=179676 RepID=A0A336KA20_CULSO
MFIIYLIISMTLAIVVGCPSEMCLCKWKGGKQTVECGGKYLTRIPDGMDPGTQVLNFSGNSLTILQSERFMKMGLTNLQKIYLARNQIFKIHDRAFQGLTNLVELDLSENVISQIPTESFVDYASLMRLILNGNPIKEIRMAAFRHLTYLATLEMSDCQVEVVHDGAFIGLDSIEWLRLDGNRIQTIMGSNILPTTLHGINLQGNRWNCDCNLIDIHTWLNRFNVPQQEEPKCVSPTKLAGRVIKHVKVGDLACIPEIEPNAFFIEVSEGRNLSLKCIIRGTPEPEISWWFQGQMIQTTNDSLLTNDGDTRLFYDVNTSNLNNKNKTWHKQTILYINDINRENNGTYVCVADNSGGRTEANFTIRVVVKEEPIVEQVTFPYEYFVFLGVGAICIVFIFILTICILVCRCRKNSQKKNVSRKRKKDFQLDSTGQKCVSISNETDDTLTCSKLNGSILITDNNPQEMMLYIAANNSQNVNISDVPLGLGINNSGNNCNLSSSQYATMGRNNQQSLLEPNPDLINDAEARGIKNDSDSDKTVDTSVPPPPSVSSASQAMIPSDMHQEFMPPPGYGAPVQLVRPVPARFNIGTLPRGISREMYQHQVDVHLNPGCFLDANGYPLTEYAFSKPIPIATTNNAPVNYYRTLPHKKHHQQNTVRFSDSEFLTQQQQQQQQQQQSQNMCQTYANDIRYTVQGYPYIPVVPIPIQTDTSNFPSPPEGYKTEVTEVTTSYCISPSMQQQQQWPSVLPGYTTQQHSQIVPIKTQNAHDVKRYSAASQTVSPSPTPPLPSSSSSSSNSGLTPSNSSSNLVPVLKKSISAQTNETTSETIPEQEEDDEEDDDEIEDRQIKHLSGPLADSPDEGYVGDSQDTCSDI